MEQTLREAGISDIQTLSLDEMDATWEKVKKQSQ
jgi:uncharacterized protein YabN with tetrapyrrole methylase and pyrophosphatase domain